MKMFRRAVLGALALPALARAQGAPIRMVVPFPPGGTTDALARIVASGMTQRLGQSVVVENRPGAGGAIGAEVAARAAPDGSTLLFHNISFPTTTATLAQAGRATHDVVEDFVPISLAANVPFVLIASPTVQASDLRGFIAVARAASPGLFYGSTGAGSIMHLVGEVLQRDAGLRMEHVPFRGAAPLVQDMLAGRIQMGGDQLATSLENIRAGALRGLASLSARRSPALPEMPTVSEQGLPNLELEGWNGLFAPARTPAATVARLQDAAAASIRQPEVTQRLIGLGAEPVGSDAVTFGMMVTTQYSKIRNLVADVQLRPE